MSTQRVVVCDNCGEEGDDGPVPAKNIRYYRENLKRAGWRFTTRRDLCPECSTGSAQDVEE